MMMEPQDVIENVNDMNIWHNKVWVNHVTQTYFVPIWRNGNTEFMYLADKFGYVLDKLENPEYTGYAFIRHPIKRIAGQIWRGMENQGFTLEHCIENLQTDADPHFRTQQSFLDAYDCEHLIDLDNLQPVGNVHIDAVIEYMLEQEQPRSANKNKQQIQQQLVNYKSEIETAYHADYELYYRDREPAHVGVIGNGKIGSVLIEVLNSAGITTSVYDIKGPTDTVERVLSSRLLWICVDTPTDSWGDTADDQATNFDYTRLQAALDQFACVGKPTIVGCTVAPGTTRSLSETTDNHLIYMPFLISQGDVSRGLTHPDCWFVGGPYHNTVEHVIKEISESDIHWGSFEEAELAKAMYNAWIIQKINFANWAGDLGYELDADAHKVMHWLTKCDQLITGPAYMTPGWGDGGPCHPRDNLMMSWLNTKLGIDYDPAWNNHTVRIMQAEHMAQRAISTELPVIILGKSYKRGIDDTTGSYSVLVANIIRDMGGEVYFEDHTQPGDYCYILAHNEWYGHTPSEKSEIINVW